MREILPGDVQIGKIERYYHVSAFARPELPTLTMGEPHLVKGYVWGYAASFLKDIHSKIPKDRPANARAETIFTTPMFRTVAKTQRCLVFVDGFYEYHWNDPAGKSKTPYLIYMPGKRPYAMGGVYNTWYNRATGDEHRTVAILTTKANERMSWIHNGGENSQRMPFIVDEEKWGLWLDPGMTQEQGLEIMKPYPDGVLQDHAVTSDIGKRGDTNYKEIQDPCV